MKKMESKKLRSPRWWDSLIGPKNSNSKWVQENLEEMNRNVTRMLKVIENSSAESRQELIKLVVKCYSIHCSLAERCNHGTGEVLNYIPNSHLIRSHAPDITSLPLLSQHPSSKKFNNVHERSVSKQLKRRVSVKGSNNHIRGQITKCQASRSTYDMCMDYSSGYNGYGGYGSGYGGYGSGYGSGYGGYGSGFGSGKSQLQMSLDLWPKPEPPSSNYFSNYYSYTQSDDNDDEVLEAEICDMIVKLYIQLEGDRVDKALLEEKLDLNVRGVQSQQPVKISTRPPPLPPIIRSKSQSESDYSFSSSNYSDTQSVGDDDEEEELEAELHNMIVKLYIQLEGDRVDKALLGEKLDLNVRGLQSQQPVKISTRPPSLPPIIRSKSQSESDYSFSSSNYSDTQSVGDDDEEELEAELHNMIVKLYIQLEGDRVDKALLEEKLDLNVRGLQSQQQVKISTRPPPLPPIIRSKSQSESDYSFSSSDYSDTQNNDDDGDELGHDELEAELHNMIEKLYIELEWDRAVSKFQGEILKYEDHTHDDDEEFISSNVDKALLEENLKLQAEISRLLKEMSYLEEYNEEIEAVVAERDQLKARVATLTADLRVYLEGTPGVVNQCSSF